MMSFIILKFLRKHTFSGKLLSYGPVDTPGVPNSVLHWLYNLRADSCMPDTLHLPTNTNLNMSAAAPKVKKAAKPKVPAAHPPYASMIAAAIKGLGDKKGSSRQAILKYVVANNKVDAAKAAVRVRLALKKMIAAKKVVAAAAAGKKGAGSFKLAAKEKKPKAKKVKKPKAKKPKKVKKAKKPAAKKPKKAAKKPAAKKAAKPKAKKSAAKKVAKKAAPKKK